MWGLSNVCVLNLNEGLGEEKKDQKTLNEAVAVSGISAGGSREEC